MSVATKDSMNKYGLLGHTNNQMTILLNRIERQLGLSVLPLPDGLKKDDWAGIIMEDTLPVYSTYMPRKMTVIVRPEDMKDGWFHIDRHLPHGTRIISTGDIDWEAFSAYQTTENFGIVRYAIDYLAAGNNALDMVSMQISGTDMFSLFSTAGLQVYIETLDQNKVRLVSISGNPVSQFRPFPFIVYVEHVTLNTISPSAFDPFFRLARCDVANTIYQVLKFHDGLDTAYGNLDLKLDTLQQVAGEREDILRELREASLTTANSDMRLIMTV